MTKIALLILTLFLPSCVSAMPPVCDPGHNNIPIQSNVVENILGQELMWRQEDFPIMVVIDPSVRDARKQAVLEAIDRWNQKVGIEVFTSEVSTDGNKEGAIFISEGDLGGPDVCGNQVLAWARRYYRVNGLGIKKSIYRAVIKLHTEVSPELVVATIVHELGHTLGCNHDLEEYSIMYPYILRGRGIITQEDIDFVRRMIFRNHIPRNIFPQQAA